MRPLLDKILVYIDGSDRSITALQYALCLARQSGGSVCALYVVNTRALDELVNANIFLQVEQEEYTTDIEADANRYLNFARDMARGKGIEIETVCRRGSILQEILAHIKESTADLLVIGELSRINSRLDALHDDTERAMRMSGCSVLIVKDDDRVEDIFEKLT